MAIWSGGTRIFPEKIEFRALLPFRSDSFSARPAPRSLEGVLGEFWNKPYNELIALVPDTNHAVCGFQNGELALAVLKKRDDVDISPYVRDANWVSYSLANPPAKAVSNLEIPTALTSQLLQHIGQNLTQARAPYGLRGLHFHLKQDPHNPDFQQALFRTDEWLAFEKVFGNGVSAQQLVSLAGDLEWDQLSSCMELLKKDSLVPLEPRALLLQWVQGGPARKGPKEGSKVAAQILACTQRDWLCSALTDEEMAHLLAQLSPEDDSTVLLVALLLKTPRKPKLWQGAREILAARSKDESYLTLPKDELLQKLGLIAPSAKAPLQKTMPAASEKVNVQPKPVRDKTLPDKIALDKTANNKAAVKTLSASSPSHVIYMVQKTQSLAAIAQSLNVSFIELKKLNPHLASSPRLAPGTAVKIPVVKSSANIQAAKDPKSASIKQPVQQATRSQSDAGGKSKK